MKLKGSAAAPGYAKGRVALLTRHAVKVSDRPILPEEVASQSNRFFAGRSAYESYLQQLLTTARKRGNEQEAAILDGHLELLLDEELESNVVASIRDSFHCAEKATALALDAIISEMDTLDDPYARQRMADFRDLKHKLLAGIAGAPLDPAIVLKEPAILVGFDLAPSDTASLDTSMLLGIISETGGVTSHVAIISQSLGIPAVVAVPGATEQLQDGDDVLLDGFEGVIIKNPSRQEIEEHHAKEEQFQEDLKLLSALKEVAARTTDGVGVELCANVGNERDVDAAVHHGALGIGLFRTEFLFLERTCFPSEEDQFIVYRKVAEAMRKGSVIIRTLDIGGDKPLPYFAFPHEDNPFLGWRAVRIYRDHPEIIRTQLRAILRASHFGSLKIMFPMIISPSETAWLLTMLEEVKDELRAHQVPFDTSLETGIMVETPAAVMLADELIEMVDFFSVGSNDLTQYTLAVDRGNQKVASLFDQSHPAVLRQIKKVIDASHARGKWTGICGELAGDEHAVALLLGMGIDEFSVSPHKLQKVKRVILQTSMTEAKALAAKMLS